MILAASNAAVAGFTVFAVLAGVLVVFVVRFARQIGRGSRKGR